MLWRHYYLYYDLSTSLLWRHYSLYYDLSTSLLWSHYSLYYDFSIPLLWQHYFLLNDLTNRHQSLYCDITSFSIMASLTPLLPSLLWHRWLHYNGVTYPSTTIFIVTSLVSLLWHHLYCNITDFIIMTSLTPLLPLLLWHHWLHYYDVTYPSITIFIVTPLISLLWRHLPFYYTVLFPPSFMLYYSLPLLWRHRYYSLPLLWRHRYYSLPLLLRHRYWNVWLKYSKILHLCKKTSTIFIPGCISLSIQGTIFEWVLQGWSFIWSGKTNHCKKWLANLIWFVLSWKEVRDVMASWCSDVI